MENLVGWIAVVGLIAIVAFAVGWAIASRTKSRRWGHPVEFAGTMVDPDEPRPSIEDESEGYQSLLRDERGR